MAIGTELKVATILPQGSKQRSAMQDFVAKRSGSIVDFDETASVDPAQLEKVSLIVVDWSTPCAYDYIEAAKSSRLTSRTPVIGIRSEGNEGAIAERMMIVPDQEVTDSLSQGELQSLADRVLSIHAARPRHFFLDILLRLGTDDEEMERAFMFFEPIYEDLGYDMKEQTLISYSLREAVGNAAEHGNGKEPSKLIHIAFMVDHEKMCLVVTDEGEGFDHRAYVEKVSQESALDTTQGRNPEVRPGGLGFHMMRETCDKVCYNDSGNSIYLMKKLPSGD